MQVEVQGHINLSNDLCGDGKADSKSGKKFLGSKELSVYIRWEPKWRTLTTSSCTQTLMMATISTEISTPMKTSRATFALPRISTMASTWASTTATGARRAI